MVTKSRLIYLSQFLSAWGDRMWNFAVAIFLMDLAPDSLLLPAAFGLTLAASVLMFGPLVGDWIDRTPRLRAAQLSLITQNSSVATCAVILLIQKLSLVENEGFLVFVKVSAMLLGLIARLGSVASSIIIQKDWIVVIANGNESLLANLNSVLRRIDLFTKLLAPLVCGQVITFVSLPFGCGFVAGWNMISMFIEYFLLRTVYNRTPALAHKAKPSSNKMQEEALLENPENPASKVSEDEDMLGESLKIDGRDSSPGENPSVETKNKEGVEDALEESRKRDDGETSFVENLSPEKKLKPSIWAKIFGFLLAIPRGWKQYMSQSVAKPGIGLSCLYMTVLGFDAITNSYAYNQCFSELLVGILLGAGGLTGIIATFLFSPISAKIGVIKTGILSSAAQVLTLIPCVVSVFAAGSPFILLGENKKDLPNETTLASNLNVTFYENSTVDASTTIGVPETEGYFLKCIEGLDPPSSYLSLSLLMSGIVLARVGLWGFDLAVTQLFQLRVPESERGVVGGVQSSLNCLMDLLHYILVIALPNPNMFGILVIVSAAFVVAGHGLYAIFAYKELGKPTSR